MDRIKTLMARRSHNYSSRVLIAIYGSEPS